MGVRTNVSMDWKIGAAKAVGTSHSRLGESCQDNYDVATSPDGEWIAACISDGAGSAKHASIGSMMVSKRIARNLIDCAGRFGNHNHDARLRAEIALCIVTIHDELRQRDGDIADYNCTLVAALINRAGNGWLIHIGDGAAVGGKCIVKPDIEKSAEAWTEVVFSKPENGEYSNETYFITEPTWTDHLRITSFFGKDWLVLMSDGGMALAFRGLIPKSRFLGPVLARVARSENLDSACTDLENILSDPQADSVTDDDKSLIVIVSAGLATYDALDFTDDAPSQPKIPVASLSKNTTSSPVATDSSQAQRQDLVNAISDQSAGAETEENAFVRVRGLFFRTILFLALVVAAGLWIKHCNWL